MLNIKLTIKQLPKTFKMLNLWRIFAKSGHPDGHHDERHLKVANPKWLSIISYHFIGDSRATTPSQLNSGIDTECDDLST